MAKKYYDGDITLTTDWGGDSTTGNLPVVGSKVQKVIKESINSKVGYVGRVDKTGQGFYVLSRDEETFNAYLETITDENPFGDLMMDGINGRFDAPFNYKMNITLLNPENGYKSALAGSTGNVIKFTAETRDANDTPQGESLTITFKIITEGGVESTYTTIYDGQKASAGIEYNLDGKLGTGQNTVVITAVGMNTGISAMRRITYRMIDMYFNDKFDIAKRYAFSSDGRLSMNIGYGLKGVGKTQIVWYFDGNLYRTTTVANTNPNLSNAVESFHFTEMTDVWLTPGVHNLQMSMICLDTDSGEEFQTPIYYREFIIEKTPSILNAPYIVRKTSFDASYGFLTNGEAPTLYNIKQYENIEFEFAAYYNGKSNCSISTHATYPSMEMIEVLSEELPLISDGFSAVRKQVINAAQKGIAEITLRAHYFGSDEYKDTTYFAEIAESDMNIVTVTDSVALSLTAFGRSNNAANKDTWDYEYTDEFGDPQKITTTFSKNEYVVASTKNEFGTVFAPSDATSENTKTVSVLPTTQEEDYKYVLYNGEYYIWTREFDWSNTSGWADNKLKIANGNSITINYQPFTADKLETLQERGGTYEFEFETTNVYNDDAVICRIAGTNNFAPGITIYASGAELVVSREVVEPEYDEEGNQINENAGYIKAVSTKYKAEESNRISFVITPDSETNDDGTPYRDRILKIYVNGEICGAYPYDKGTNFLNDAKITFRGSEEACINISSIQIYKRALSSNEILNNYIYYRNNTDEKAAVYKRNDIMLLDNDEAFDSNKLKSQLPIMTFYQIDPNQSLDDIHQEKKNKKLTRFFDVVYVDIQNPHKNFLVKNAYVTPQGTSSMNYPVKNLRLYTGKKDDKTKEYYSRMFVGDKIFIDGSPNNLSWDNINLESEVKDKKRRYSFRDEDKNSGQKAAAPVNCWCLKADFAESSSSHNTGTARFWNNVLMSNGLLTKAQAKAAEHADKYPYDTRTCVDGFPIAVFYQQLDGSSPRFEGKYNFNNDKSTEDVFGFTGGEEIDDQEIKYFYVGKEKPIVQYDSKKDEWGCSFESGAYTETPTEDSPLYASKYLPDGTEEWYMLRSKALLDNPKMECWELLNSVNEIALFKTMKGFGIGDGDEKVGIVDGENFDEAFESRFPDCGDYYHTNSLRRFGEWLVSCRYLDIDPNTGESVPFKYLPQENYHKENGKLKICSLSKKTGEFVFNFPDYNFYKEVPYDSIASKIKQEGYQQIEIKDEDVASLEFKDVTELPTEKDTEVEYLRCDGYFYTWLPSNLLVTDTLPEVQEVSYDYILVGDVYYVWDNKYKFENYHETQLVDDTAFNRALKFAIEKYDHIEMDKMAAYYIYLMRFGGVDQTVKNSMLTTEGPATDDPNSTLPSLWYFINYDNDTILGVKNDGRLVFDPYITRQTKDGTGYVYAGRESTLWNNLEADVQFMEHVTEIDNVLAKGENNSLYALSYSNAIREYDDNQSDKWCERIYNKDAERKYIQTYVEGWTQKIAASGTTNHVYEDYLYDVQGSRSAHRKWWLGRRFNVFDSRFCNTNFRNSLIKFRSTNLPAGSSFTIKSGEPVFYAWGHDNAVTEITSKAIQPGDTCTFTTRSAFNIGSYLEVMGSANISTFDLRDCVGALTELDITGCYSHSVGTKMKEVLVGDHTRTDLVNISNTSLKFSGLDKASKLEVLDMTNIKNAMAFDGLNTLLNIREVYAKGTSVSNFTFADGAMIERIELPTTVETLSLTRSSSISYDNIVFEGDGYGRLVNLTLDNCSQLMSNPNFVLDWIAATPKEQRKNLSVNLQGIDWTFNDSTLAKLFLLEEVGTSGMAVRNIRGNIRLNDKINNQYAVRLQNIFGEECFKEGSKVYIDAPTAVYVNMPTVLWEGDAPVKCEIITVGTTLGGKLSLVATVREKGSKEDILINNTNGNITMDNSTLNNGYATFTIKENDQNYEFIYVDVRYTDEDNMTYGGNIQSTINKRIYPTSVNINTVADSFTNDKENPMTLSYVPSEINDVKLTGRGVFTVAWSMVSGTTGYDKNVMIIDGDKETAKIQAPYGFDGLVTVKASVTRTFDNAVMCEATKQLEFKNPNTIVTEISNKPLYDILVDANIIQVVDGYGKLTKSEAGKVSMADLVKDGKSIFAGNTSLKSFVEFEWFSSLEVGQMPIEGVEKVYTPNGMFSGCTNLVEIALSDNFKYSANDMFKGCTNLEAIYGASQGRLDEDNNPIYTTLSLEYVGDNFASGCTKLHTCKLSSMVEHIGAQAFKGCKSLNEFNVPSNSNLTLVYTTKDTPFTECENIIFTGTNYGEHGEMSYCVKDGACYEVNKDGTLTLIHMGKNTPSSSIPTDKVVYACAYSMEYRTEPHVVIPANVVFNGDRIFNNSVGQSVTLNNLLSNGNCSYLFAKTKYKGNYTFAPGETIIPTRCFADVSDMTSFVVPEGIRRISTGSFYPANALTEITFPTTLESIDEQVFWLSPLKKITFKSAVPPSLKEDLLYGSTPDAIYVYPEYYNTYKTNVMHLIAPFITPIKLYNEGYVRIIKDGAFVVADETNVVTVGGLSVTQDNDYMKYVSVDNVSDINVRLNGTIVGQIAGQYTTIYVGDNSSLISGDGMNFRYGVNNETVKAELNANGWFYDPRFEGIRSVKSDDTYVSSEITLSLPAYANTNTPVVFGMYSYLDSESAKKVYGYFKDSNDNILLKNRTLGYNITGNITTNNGIIKPGFVGGLIKTGIDGIVINEVGNALYSDPELPAIATMSLDENPVTVVTVTLDSPVAIPNNVYVTLTDGKAHTYRKYWNGEPLMFVIPTNFEFTATASSFVTENGKTYFVNKDITVSNENNVNITYTCETGIEIKNNILAYHTVDTDWYVNLNVMNGTWGEVNVPEVNALEVLASDADGYTNTQEIAKYSNETIFAKAVAFNKFENGVIGYIPSYVELELFATHLPVVNNYLASKGKQPISLNNLWVSEAFNETLAWNSNGEKVEKTNTLNYYIFGKRITL